MEKHSFAEPPTIREPTTSREPIIQTLRYAVVVKDSNRTFKLAQPTIPRTLSSLGSITSAGNAIFSGSNKGGAKLECTCVEIVCLYSVQVPTFSATSGY